MVISCQPTRGGFIRYLGWGVFLILCVWGGTLGRADQFLANTGQRSIPVSDDQDPAQQIENPKASPAADISVEQSQVERSVPEGSLDQAGSDTLAKSAKAGVHPKDGVSIPMDFEKQRIGKSHGEKAPANKDPKQKAGPVTAGTIWRTVLSLVLVLVLIVGGSYWLRHFSPRGKALSQSGGIEIIARNHVNPKQSMCLVKVGPRLLLVGLSPNHMASLDVIDDPEEVSQVLGHIETDRPHSISNTFGRLFHRESREFTQEEGDKQEVELDSQEEERKPYFQARGELAGLLNKVKGLRRLGGRF
ncbi:MAG: flagellar biosynthetic protein FliO [Planctomycetes bacterium]|nr:flagellar biosynthetic protein FliO [Planctomycetota bacterium]